MEKSRYTSFYIFFSSILLNAEKSEGLEDVRYIGDKDTESLNDSKEQPYIK